MHADNLTTIPLTATIAERAAGLRAEHNLRTPDAIQLATALESGASHFLTNDADLARVSNVKLLLLNKLMDEVQTQNHDNV
jgi:predicted nucleic acid-binding protein